MVDNSAAVTSALTLMDPRVSDPAATWRNPLSFVPDGQSCT